MTLNSYAGLSLRSFWRALLFLLAIVFIGCGASDQEPDTQGTTPSVRNNSVENQKNSVRIELEKSDDEMLLSFYIGGMLPSDWELDSVLSNTESGWEIRSPNDGRLLPDAVQSLFLAAGSDQTLSWEEFEPVVTKTYYEVRNAPETLQDLKSQYGDWESETWFSHELVGQMTHYRRRLSVSKHALFSTLSKLTKVSDPIIYPIGTVFIGEHLDGEIVREVTAMVKRDDGYWDYFAYSQDGRLTLFIEKKPDPLSVPTQCVGCHYGDRLFEPEKSFPKAARPGPNGERAYFLTESLKNMSINSALSEHGRRSDHILGLYGTIYLAKLVGDVKAGTASGEEAQLIARLGLN